MASKGFTLVELLASISVVGILSALSVANYLEYRQTAYDAIALIDFKNFIVAQEAYIGDNNEYLTCYGANCKTLMSSYGLQAHDKTYFWAVFAYGDYWYGHSLSFTPDVDQGTAGCMTGTGVDYFYQSSDSNDPGPDYLYGTTPIPGRITNVYIWRLYYDPCWPY